MPPESANAIYIALIVTLALLIVLVVVAVRRRPEAAPPAPPAPSEIEAVPYLERAGAGDSLPRYPLNKPMVLIGRAEDSDIRIPIDWPGAHSVSRRHAQIRREDTEYVVEDLGSQNGIRVNGLATHRNLLREGYRITFGSVEFVYRAAPSSEADRGDA